MGAGIWILFSQLLEPIVHYFILGNTSIGQNPWLFAVYGALAAGVFEEVGRYIGFNYYLKDKREWRDGVGYGLGHGGVEAVLLGGLGLGSVLAIALLINSGQEAQVAARLPEQAYNSIRQSLTGPSGFFLLAGLERLFAITFHVALSLIVLYGAVKDKVQFLLLTIFLHILIDFPAALYQAGKLSIVIVEVVGLVCAIIFAYVIYRMRALFVADH